MLESNKKNLIEKLEKAGNLQHAFNLAVAGYGLRFMKEESWALTDEEIDKIYLASEGELSLYEILPPGMKTPFQRKLAWKLLAN